MEFEIVIDAKDPYALAHFWAAAIPEYQVRAYDSVEIARLRSFGLTPETDPSLPIDSEHGPTIWFQKSDKATTVRNRIHFDLKYGERRSESLRLQSLGAAVQVERKDHIVLIDPEGNQFCLFDP